MVISVAPLASLGIGTVSVVEEPVILNVNVSVLLGFPSTVFPTGGSANSGSNVFVMVKPSVASPETSFT